MTEKTFIPFSNGAEFMVWNEMNCDQCAKNPTLDDEDWTVDDPCECEIFMAITIGCLTGEAPESIGKRMGMVDDKGEEVYPHDGHCPEFKFIPPDLDDLPDTEKTIRQELREEVGLT